MKFEMSVNAMQKNDGPTHMLRYFTIVLLLRLSLHVLYRHNSKAVNLQEHQLNSVVVTSL